MNGSQQWNQCMNVMILTENLLELTVEMICHPNQRLNNHGGLCCSL